MSQQQHNAKSQQSKKDKSHHKKSQNKHHHNHKDKQQNRSHSAHKHNKTNTKTQNTKDENMDKVQKNTVADTSSQTKTTADTSSPNDKPPQEPAHDMSPDEKNKKILTKQSKTILRKLAYKSGINSLSNSCYPIIYHVIDTLLEKIFDTIQRYIDNNKDISAVNCANGAANGPGANGGSFNTKKTISANDLLPIFQEVNSNVDKSRNIGSNADDNAEYNTIFTATVFKRQLQPYFAKTNTVKLSANGVKAVQTFVEQTMLQILKTASNISQNAKRTRVLDRDMELSWKMFNENSL